jgi:ribose transport system substrate-binding protein
MNRISFLKRAFQWISILVILASLLSACAQPTPAPTKEAEQEEAQPAAQEEPEKKNTLGYIAAGVENYYKCQESGVRKKAEELGVDLVVLNSNSKADEEIGNMEDMIAKKVDAILIMTTNAAAGQKALQMANKANIPVILVGINVEDGPGKPLSLIDFDFADMGRAAGEWVAANVEEGEVAIIEGLAGMNVAEPITAGFEEKLAANTNLKIVAKQPADWSRQKAQDIATNLILSHPNLKVIYSHNDDMAMGVIKAIEEANKQDQIILVSDNASPEGVEAIKAGKLAGSVAQSPAVDEGELAVQLAYDYLNGEEIPEHVREDLFFLTQDNIDKAKAWCYD